MPKLQLAFKNNKIFLSFTIQKVRKAIGIYSITKSNPLKHYALFDLDTKEKDKVLKSIRYMHKKCTKAQDFFICETKNGFHMIAFQKYTLIELGKLLLLCPNIDLSWLAIGLKRGYWFLENYKELPKPLQEMYNLNYGEVERIDT